MGICHTREYQLVVPIHSRMVPKSSISFPTLLKGIN